MKTESIGFINDEQAFVLILLPHSAGPCHFTYLIYLLVHFEPGDVTFGVLKLQSKVPGLPEADRTRDKIKELLSRGLDVQAEFQFGIHGADLDRKTFSGAAGAADTQAAAGAPAVGLLAPEHDPGYGQ